MNLTALKTLALNARAPIGWMLLGVLIFGLYSASSHWTDHGEFHTMVRWVNKADQEIVALKKQIVALEKRTVTP